MLGFPVFRCGLAASRPSQALLRSEISRRPLHAKSRACSALSSIPAHLEPQKLAVGVPALAVLEEGATVVPQHLAAAPTALEETPAVALTTGPATAPEFLDLPSLVKRLSLELPANPQRGAPVDEAVLQAVSQLLRQTRLNPREWRQHAVFRRGRYTRNIVGYSPGQFVALLLCWERGQQSPIHDHSGAHCFIKMLSGRLREETFAWAEDGRAGEPTGDGVLDAGVPASSVGFMHDAKGLHRISNPSADEAAVSLHIYSPPFSECLVFPPTGAEPKRAPMVSVNMPAAAMMAPSSPRLSLQGFCAALGRLPGGLGDTGGNVEEEAFRLLAVAELSPMDWAMYASPVHFSEFHCVQNLVHCDERFSMVVSCWSPGQSMPPHMLGRGRRTWLKVLHGSLQWQLFSPALFPWESDVERQTELAEGSVSELQECAVKLHSFRNGSDTDIAVSLQVFSPPLTQFAFQTRNGIERQDVPSLLAAPNGLQTSATQTEGGGVTQPNGQAVELSNLNGLNGAVRAPSEGLRGLQRVPIRRYLSFAILVGLLDEELNTSDFSDEDVSALLKRAVFNPEEWRSCLGRAFLSGQGGGAPAQEPNGRAQTGVPQQMLLAQRRRYSLRLFFWARGDRCAEETPRELQDYNSWTSVLEGELQEELVGPSGGAVHVCTVKEDGLSFHRKERGGLGVRWSCDADVPCVSLHLHVLAAGKVQRSGS